MKDYIKRGLRAMFPSEANSWYAAQRRCDDPNHDQYENYGGRGITFSDHWRDNEDLGQDGFFNFLRDVGQRPNPKDKYQLDRIRSDGNYEPGNVKWSTERENALNRRTTKWISLGNRKECLKDWCTSLDQNYNTVVGRIFDGWNPLRALITPTGRKTWTQSKSSE